MVGKIEIYIRIDSDDDGSRSEFFQDGYEAQHAIDDIHDLIGDI